MLNNERQAEAEVESSTTVEDTSVSRHIANTMLAVSGGELGEGYFKEAGKTWYQYKHSKSIFRVRDENFQGMRFEHKRCPFCGRITSIHTLHWLNHLEKCAPEKYSDDDLMRLQHYTPEQYEKIAYGFLGRKG